MLGLDFDKGQGFQVAEVGNVRFLFDDWVGVSPFKAFVS